MTEIQISSGQGPAECELAVGKFFNELVKEFADIETIDFIKGKGNGLFKSIHLKSSANLESIIGSIQWICTSPFRPNHKRKNWFIDVSLFKSSQLIEYSKTDLSFETFRSSGRGGQHVNKVETGVRVIHNPTGISVISTDARSQHMNKQIAIERLSNILAEHNMHIYSSDKSDNRKKHYDLERGNPIRVYKGVDFKRIK